MILVGVLRDASDASGFLGVPNMVPHQSDGKKSLQHELFGSENASVPHSFSLQFVHGANRSCFPWSVPIRDGLLLLLLMMLLLMLLLLLFSVVNKSNQQTTKLARLASLSNLPRSWPVSALPKRHDRC